MFPMQGMFISHQSYISPFNGKVCIYSNHAPLHFLQAATKSGQYKCFYKHPFLSHCSFLPSYCGIEVRGMNRALQYSQRKWYFQQHIKMSHFPLHHQRRSNTQSQNTIVQKPDSHFFRRLLQLPNCKLASTTACKRALLLNFSFLLPILLIITVFFSILDINCLLNKNEMCTQ